MTDERLRELDKLSTIPGTERAFLREAPTALAELIGEVRRIKTASGQAIEAAELSIEPNSDICVGDSISGTYWSASKYPDLAAYLKAVKPCQLCGWITVHTNSCPNNPTTTSGGMLPLSLEDFKRIADQAIEAGGLQFTEGGTHIVVGRVAASMSWPVSSNPDLAGYMKAVGK